MVLFFPHVLRINMENNFNSLYPEGSGKMVEEGVIQDVSCKVVSSKHERDTCALEISTTW